MKEEERGRADFKVKSHLLIHLHVAGNERRHVGVGWEHGEFLFRCFYSFLESRSAGENKGEGRGSGN